MENYAEGTASLISLLHVVNLFDVGMSVSKTNGQVPHPVHDVAVQVDSDRQLLIAVLDSQKGAEVLRPSWGKNLDAAIYTSKSKEGPAYIAVRKDRALRVYGVSKQSDLALNTGVLDLVGLHVSWEIITFWKWIAFGTLVFVTPTAVFEWRISDIFSLGKDRRDVRPARSSPLKLFTRPLSLTGHLVIDYAVSRNGEWHMLVQDRLQTGTAAVIHQYSSNERQNRFIQGDIATFNIVMMQPSTSPTEVFIYAIGSESMIKVYFSDHLSKITSENHWAAIMINSHILNDIPTLLGPSTISEFFYVLTQSGWLYVYNFNSQSLLGAFQTGLGALASATYGQTFTDIDCITQNGQVSKISINKSILASCIHRNISYPTTAVDLDPPVYPSTVNPVILDGAEVEVSMDLELTRILESMDTLESLEPVALKQQLVKISYNESLREQALGLRGEAAARFSNLILTCIRSLPENVPDHAMVLRFLQDVSSLSGELPSSLWLRGVIVNWRRPIGRGGEALVYPGSFMDQTVVVRKVHETDAHGWLSAGSQATFAFIRREIIMHAQLRHRNVIPLMGVFRESSDEPPMMVLPFMAHGSAVEFLRRASSEKLANLARVIIKGVTSALAYLHGRNPVVVHGDLHPGNILIDTEGEAVLCDFGLSRMRYDETRTFTTIREGGRLRFLAPELSAGSPRFRTTPSSDIYSLAMSFVMLVTLALPFNSYERDFDAVHAAERGVRPGKPDIMILTPTDGDLLWALIERMWDQEPSKRPSAPEVKQSLDLAIPSTI